MLSYFAKWCFALTAVAPAFGGAAVVSIASYNSIEWGIGFVVAALLSVLISCLLLRFVKSRVAVEQIDCTEIEHADQHVLEFLLAYLLPLFSATSQDTLVAAMSLAGYSMCVVLLTVVHGDVFLFNPVLAAFGYHFYFVKDANGMKYLLISKAAYHKAVRSIQGKPIGNYMYLDATK